MTPHGMPPIRYAAATIRIARTSSTGVHRRPSIGRRPSRLGARSPGPRPPLRAASGRPSNQRGPRRVRRDLGDERGERLVDRRGTPSSARRARDRAVEPARPRGPLPPPRTWSRSDGALPPRAPPMPRATSGRPSAAGSRDAASEQPDVARRAAPTGRSPRRGSPRTPRGAGAARPRSRAGPRRPRPGPGRRSRSSRCRRGWRPASTTSSSARRRATAAEAARGPRRDEPARRARPRPALVVAATATPMPPVQPRDAVRSSRLDGRRHGAGDQRGRGRGSRRGERPRRPTPFDTVRTAASGHAGRTTAPRLDVEHLDRDDRRSAPATSAGRSAARTSVTVAVCPSRLDDGQRRRRRGPRTGAAPTIATSRRRRGERPPDERADRAGAATTTTRRSRASTLERQSRSAGGPHRPARVRAARTWTGWTGGRRRGPICQRHVSESQTAASRRVGGGPDLLEQRRSDGHRDVVLLLLEPVRPGDPAAVVVEVDGGAGRAPARTGPSPAARSRGSGAGTAHGRAASRRSARTRVEAALRRGGRASSSQMSQVASETARASASSRSSISRYSDLSVWVHEVDVPTIR